MAGLSTVNRALRHARRFPYMGFVPNGKQREMIRLRETSEKLFVGLSAANGNGKTTLGINMICNMVGPATNKYFGDPFWQKPHGPRRVRIISSPRHIADDGALQNQINRWFPPAWLENSRKDKLGYRHLFPNCNGWEVQIMSNRLETNEYAAKEVSWEYFDEPFRKAIFGENKARLRMGGHGVITLTPITEPGAEMTEIAWIWEEMIEGDEQDAEFIFGDICDNCREHGKPGFVPHEGLHKVLVGCDDEEYEARAHGRYKNVGGAVYPAWRNNKDTILMEPRSFREWMKPGGLPPTIYMMVDPHDQKPFAMLWFAQYADGHGEFFYEYPDEQEYHKTPRSKLTIADYVQIIRRIEARFAPLRPHVRMIDKNYGNQERIVGQRRTTIKQDLTYESNGYLRFMENPGGNSPWRNAKHRIHQFLTPRPPTDLPQWRCWHGLGNLDHAMRHYMMLTRAGRTADIHGPIMSKPAEKHKCFPNMVEWLAHLNPTWVEPPSLSEELDFDEGGYESDYARAVGFN